MPRYSLEFTDRDYKSEPTPPPRIIVVEDDAAAFIHVSIIIKSELVDGKIDKEAFYRAGYKGLFRNGVQIFPEPEMYIQTKKITGPNNTDAHLIIITKKEGAGEFSDCAVSSVLGEAAIKITPSGIGERILIKGKENIRHIRDALNEICRLERI